MATNTTFTEADYTTFLSAAAATLLTATDESADLPNSRHLLAGTNVTFDDTVPNERTVNASDGSGGDAFGTIAVSGQSDVVADQANDTLTLVAGANITLTTSAAGDSVTIVAAGSSPATYKGAMVTKAADQTAANYSAGAMIGWDSEIYDTDTFHDDVTNNSRITIPSGVTKVNIAINVVLLLVAANDLCQLALYKGGTAGFSGATSGYGVNAGTNRIFSCVAIGIPVTAGEYFEAWLQTQADTSITVAAARSFFTIQVVE